MWSILVSDWSDKRKFGQMRSFSAMEQALGQHISLEVTIFDAEHDGRKIFPTLENFGKSQNQF